MGLFNNFMRKVYKSKFKGRVFDFHEDDFCQIELLPRENLSGIDENNLNLHGFTRISRLKEKSIKTIDRNIPVAKIDMILSGSGLPKFDNVTTGYGSMQYDSEYSTAFGEPFCVIIYERSGKTVDRIWLDFYSPCEDKTTFTAMKSCLNEICTTWNLILEDWRQDLIIDPVNDLSLECYLKGQYNEESDAN